MDLDSKHKNAWISFLVAYETLRGKIGRGLEAAGQVSLEVYDVLLVLEEQPGHRIMMSELADAVLLSRSGVTRMVDRLEKQGLLKRERCPKDRRVLYAVVTDKGVSARKAAWPVYRQAVADEFAGHLTCEEAGMLTNMMLRMTGDRNLIGFET